MSEDNYLHEAIIIVLRERGRAMTAQEIADEINRRGLYKRKNGTPLPADQVRRRVTKREYAHLFDYDYGVSLSAP